MFRLLTTIRAEFYPDGYYMFHSLMQTDNIEATALTIRFVNLGLFSPQR